MDEGERGRGAAGEHPLTGGNATAGVVRVGDTVRRPAGFWTPAVHALLGHLHAVGFHAAPRPLGFDAQGREVLSFAPGTVVWPDRFHLVRPRHRVVRLGRLVRDLHDALAEFRPPPGACWQELMPADGAEIVVRNDLAPWNLVASEDGAWALIDWDTAAWGTRLWDLAYAAHGFVPLSADAHWQEPEAEAGARLRVLADAYGLDEEGRRRLVPLLSLRCRAMGDFLARRAQAGVEPWLGLWRSGHGAIWRADADYAEQREPQWLAALLD
ncbi:phosphotransferase [Streptomonospora litoralis]|nr:phosphotransferase [Streptomonospora litoralis]